MTFHPPLRRCSARRLPTPSPMTRRSRRAAAESTAGRRGRRRRTGRAIVVPSRGPAHSRSRYRLRETGMYGGAPFVEEWKPLPPRLHADVREQHTVEIGPVAVACARSLGDDGAAPTGVHARRRPRVRGVARSPAAHRSSSGSSPPTEPSFRARRPLVWNLTESEHTDGVTRFAILKGGSELPRRRLGVVLRRRTTAAGVQRQAVARWARRQPVDVDRLPPGVGPRRRADRGGCGTMSVTGQSAMGPPALRSPGVRVIDAATLFAGPLAATFLGDFGADVIKIEHPAKPDAARGHGPAARRRGPVVEDARPQQADDDPRPVDARRGRRCCSGSSSAPTC